MPDGFHVFTGTDENYKLMVAAWLHDRRCPWGLIDHLIDNGFEGAAVAARWAATTTVGGHGPYPATGAEIMAKDKRENDLKLLDPIRWYFLGAVICDFPWQFPSRHTAHGVTAEEAIYSLLNSCRIPKFNPEGNDLTPNFRG